MEKIKVGIIGAGRIGQVHAKSITYHIRRHRSLQFPIFMRKAQKRLQKNSVFRIIIRIIIRS